MKLGATITSERGKPITKTGNENLIVSINNNEKDTLIFAFTVDAFGKQRLAHVITKDWPAICQLVDKANEEKERYLKNGSLKHGDKSLFAWHKKVHGGNIS